MVYFFIMQIKFFVHKSESFSFQRIEPHQQYQLRNENSIFTLISPFSLHSLLSTNLILLGCLGLFTSALCRNPTYNEENQERKTLEKVYGLIRYHPYPPFHFIILFFKTTYRTTSPAVIDLRRIEERMNTEKRDTF